MSIENTNYGSEFLREVITAVQKNGFWDGGSEATESGLVNVACELDELGYSVYVEGTKIYPK